MDTRTGEIVTQKELGAMQREAKKFFVPLKSGTLIPRQERKRVVSMMDRKTPAAKILGSARNKPCPCGSGKKLKKCCGTLESRLELKEKK